VIVAYHSILSAYGFWLPNDPRGSWSDFVRSWELFRYGPATKTDSRRSVAHAAHDRTLRERAKTALRYPPVRFTGRQSQSIGSGFALAAAEADYRIFACAILPEHVHAVVARHDRRIEQIVQHLRARATQQLRCDACHPLARCPKRDGTLPTPWGRQAWHVYLDTPEAVQRAIRYVEGNPAQEGKPAQRWRFVVPYAPTQ